MKDDIQIVDFDKLNYPFRVWFSEVLGTEDLEHLHESSLVTLEDRESDASLLRAHCETRIDQLQDLVQEFLNSVVTPRFGPIVKSQSVPTIRFHFAGDARELDSEAKDMLAMEPSAFLTKYYFNGVRAPLFHRDSDYGLPIGPTNLWIPITDVWGANSLWIGGPDVRGKDAAPVTMNYGQALFFNGAHRWHGVVLNTSGISRVSFDVRFIPRTAST